MKNKTKLILMTVLLSASLLAGCKKGEEEKLFFGFGSEATFVENAAGLNRTGTAVVNGYVQTDIDFGAVLVDSKGVIKQFRLDVVQIKALASAKEDDTIKDATVLMGATHDTANQDTKTKWELLDAYNMIVASPIEKEWYLQAEAFENWVAGKTLAEVKAGLVEVIHHGQPATGVKDGETVGVTIVVDGFMAVLEEALDSKVEVTGVKAEDAKLGVGSKGSRGAYGNPAMQDNFTVGGAVFGAGKVVAKAKIDEYQVPYAPITETWVTLDNEPVYALEVTVNKAKVQVVEATSSIRSKHDQKEDYAMKVASPIKKEWYEQANALVAWLEGKTLDAGFASLAEGENAVTAGCTMEVASYVHALGEAEDTAHNPRYAA